MDAGHLQKFQKRPKDFILFVSRQKRYLGIVVVVFVVIARALYMVVPVMSKEITDVLTNFDGDYDVVYRYTGLLLFFLVVSSVSYRITGFVASQWIPKIEVYAAQISFDYLIRHSAQYFANRLSGKLQNKVFNISNAIASIFPILFWNFTDLFFKLTISIFLAFTVHVLIGSVFLTFTGISIIFSIFVSRKISQYSRDMTEAASEVRGVMVDVVGNILAVKQNTALARESKNVESVLDAYRIKHVKNWYFFERALVLNSVIYVLMIGVLLYFSVIFFQQGIVSAGDIVMVIILVLGLYGDLQFLSMSLNRFLEHYGQLSEGLDEVFAPHGIVDEKKADNDLEITNGEIVFDRVNFQYEEDDSQSVFNELSLTIPPGQKIGLVGESGAGKSTFVSLLLRFVEPESGKIMIDGCDISYIKQNILRSSIAYVPQEALLFHRTLEDNIKYSHPHASIEDIKLAARRAHAKEFIEKLPEAYSTFVGERGVKLSGGQKQRVMIARAMLKQSPILVLDEATSALDSESEKLIQDALEELMKDRTTIVIAHRLSTLKKMDRIVVFDNGKVVEDGTHEELLAQEGKYYSLWQYQSGKIN